MTGIRTYQRYSPEFKREAARHLIDTETSRTQLAHERGIRVNQLYRWKQQIDQNQADAFPGSGRQADGDGQVAKLPG